MNVIFCNKCHSSDNLSLAICLQFARCLKENLPQIGAMTKHFHADSFSMDIPRLLPWRLSIWLWILLMFPFDDDDGSSVRQRPFFHIDTQGNTQPVRVLRFYSPRTKKKWQFGRNRYKLQGYHFWVIRYRCDTCWKPTLYTL